MKDHALRRMAVAAILTAILAAVCLTPLASGGRSAPQKTIMVFAYFPHAFNTGTWQWYNGWQDAAAKLGPGYKVIVKEEAALDGDPAAYVNFIKTGMVQQPDGIVVVPNNSVAMTAGLKQLQSQYPKTTFQFMDTPVPGLPAVPFVGTNNRSAGVQAAKWLLAQQRTHQLVSNEVAVFQAPPGTASQDLRVAGFLATIKNSPLKVVKTIQSADSSNATAKANMADVLTGHPNLGAVFSATDNFGLGVAEELVAAKKLNIKNVSVDADTNAVQDIIDHTGMDAEIAQHFYTAGYEAVLTLGHALAGQTVPKNIDTGTALITATNAKAFLKQAAAEAKPR